MLSAAAAALLDPTTTLAIGDDDLKALAIGGALFVSFIWLVGSIIRSILIARSLEQSRREIAAYVAEGSMSPDDGAKLLNAGRPAWEQGYGAWRDACKQPRRSAC